MDAVEIGEIANFFIDILILPALIIVLKKKLAPARGLLAAACACLVLSHTFTLIENLALPRLFDTLEHLFFFSAALCFALFLRAVSKEPNMQQTGGET
jgi:hypothetical protein